MAVYWQIGLISLLAAMSPGPDFILISQLAIARSRKAAIQAALGLGTGLLFHTVVCVAGVGALLAASPRALAGLQIASAFYLLYLAWGVLRSRAQSFTLDSSGGPNAASVRSAYRMGLLTNLLNPKATLFMLSLFSGVIEPTTSKVVQLSYGVDVAVVVTVWFSTLASMLTLPALRSRLERWAGTINQLFGAALVAWAVFLLWSVYG